MCGISGIYSNNPGTRARIELMMKALGHRGPDDRGSYHGSTIALGQNRLSIIDLETGRQPLSNENGTLWLVCNGEIYNYRELQKELIGKGHRFNTGSDCEVILHLYEEEGDACVNRLRGMFAFALWDTARRRLLLARDRLGQKPLFYTHNNRGEIAFGSEIKGLVAFDPELAELDPQALDQYLSLRFIAPPLTMFKDIRKLPPAHILVFFAEAGPTIRRYWDICYEPKITGTEDELVDALEEQLIGSLKYHMVSDVPVGAFLSGGLDSSLLTAMLVKHVVGQPLNTFSMGLPYKAHDEAPYARLLANQYQTVHHEQTLRPELLTSLPELVFCMDEPSDPLSLCSFEIARFAAAKVKVVIGGDGGDELFGGYDRYYGNIFAGYYALCPPWIRKEFFGRLLNLLPDGHWYKSTQHQLKWLHQLSFSEAGERYADSLGYFYFSYKQRNSIYAEDMRHAVSGFSGTACVRDRYNHALARESIDKMLYADTHLRLPDHPVMISDRTSMAHGLEVRSPFMDHKLVEFVARLPVQMKVRGAGLRYIQRKLSERYLPREILKRKKQGFASALPYMFGRELPKIFNTFLAESSLVKEGFFRESVIKELLSNHHSGKGDHGNRLWLLASCEMWYRLHIKKHTVADMAGLVTEAISHSAEEMLQVAVAR